MDQFSLRFGKRLSKAVNLLYVSGFALHRLLGGMVLVRHQKSRKPAITPNMATSPALICWRPVVCDLRISAGTRRSIRTTPATASSTASATIKTPKTAVGICASKPNLSPLACSFLRPLQRYPSPHGTGVPGGSVLRKVP